jgi:hypothetical protein
MGPRVALAAMENRNTFCHCRESNPGCPARSRVGIPIELLRLPWKAQIAQTVLQTRRFIFVLIESATGLCPSGGKYNYHYALMSSVVKCHFLSYILGDLDTYLLMCRKSNRPPETLYTHLQKHFPEGITGETQLLLLTVEYVTQEWRDTSLTI